MYENKLHFLQNLLALSAVTLIIIIWSIVSFLIYRDSLIKKSVNVVNDLPKSVQKNEYYNWNTYISKSKTKYEIKYPKSWSVIDSFSSEYELVYLNNDPSDTKNIDQLRLSCPSGQAFARLPKYDPHDPIINLKLSKNIIHGESSGILYIFGKSPDPRGRQFAEMCTYILRSTEPQYCSLCTSVDDKEYYDNDFIASQGLYENILSTFKFTDKTNITPFPSSPFTCPPNGWIDCMPGPSFDKEQENKCSDKAILWYEENCPNFQGVAY